MIKTAIIGDVDPYEDEEPSPTQKSESAWPRRNLPIETKRQNESDLSHDEPGQHPMTDELDRRPPPRRNDKKPTKKVMINTKEMDLKRGKNRR